MKNICLKGCEKKSSIIFFQKEKYKYCSYLSAPLFQFLFVCVVTKEEGAHTLILNHRKNQK